MDARKRETEKKEPVWPLILFIIFIALTVCGIKYTSKTESAPATVMHLWYDYEKNIPQCVVVDSANGNQISCRIYGKEYPDELRKLPIKNNPPKPKM